MVDGHADRIAITTDRVPAVLNGDTLCGDHCERRYAM